MEACSFLIIVKAKPHFFPTEMGPSIIVYMLLEPCPLPWTPNVILHFIYVLKAKSVPQRGALILLFPYPAYHPNALAFAQRFPMPPLCGAHSSSPFGDQLHSPLLL